MVKPTLEDCEAAVAVFRKLRSFIQCPDCDPPMGSSQMCETLVQFRAESRAAERAKCIAEIEAKLVEVRRSYGASEIAGCCAALRAIKGER